MEFRSFSLSFYLFILNSDSKSMDFGLLLLEIGLSLRAEVGHFVNVLLHGLQLVLDLSLGLLGFGTNSEDFEIFGSFLAYLLFIFQNISTVTRTL